MRDRSDLSIPTSTSKPLGSGKCGIHWDEVNEVFDFRLPGNFLDKLHAVGTALGDILSRVPETLILDQKCGTNPSPFRVPDRTLGKQSVCFKLLSFEVICCEAII